MPSRVLKLRKNRDPGAEATPPSLPALRFDPTRKHANVTLTVSNSVATVGTSNDNGALGTGPKYSGKWVWSGVVGSTAHVSVGIATVDHAFASDLQWLGRNNLSAAVHTISQKAFFSGGALSQTLMPYGNGDTVTVAVDLDASPRKLWWKVGQNAWNGSVTANPATDTEGFLLAGLGSGAVYPAISGYVGAQITIVAPPAITGFLPFDGVAQTGIVASSIVANTRTFTMTRPAANLSAAGIPSTADVEYPAIGSNLNPANYATPADYAAAVKALTDGTAHGDNPTMASEHAALHALVTRSAATHVAVQHGNWNTAATWYPAEIPTANSKVLIPAAIAVTVNTVKTTKHHTIRVDGWLKHSPTVNTQLIYDTLVVSGTGLLRMGTVNNPVIPTVTCHHLFADNGAIDVAWDPQLLSRGMISHGTHEAHAAIKTNFSVATASSIPVGTTSITLSPAPVGWRVGDTVAIGATKIRADTWNGTTYIDGGTDDEERTISAISGATITLSSGLSYTHNSPAGRTDLRAYIGNVTRNVVFRNENANVPTTQSGHTMWMHSDGVDVRYVEARKISRTDKNIRALNPGAQTNTATTNVKARYPFHAHLNGVGSTEVAHIVVGCSANGSPGWGFAHHGSFSDFENCIAYDFQGAGFVAEVGNERGTWRGNIAMKGKGRPISEWNLSQPKEGNDIEAGDMGRGGDGFWFQGRQVVAQDNVAVSTVNAFIFMHRDASSQANRWMIHPRTELFELPSAMKGRGVMNTIIDHTWDSSMFPIIEFRGNTVCCAYVGLQVIKRNPEQHHDVRTLIKDTKIWEVEWGIHFEYTSHYTTANTDILGSAVGWRGGTRATRGFSYGANTMDMVADGLTVSGFSTGVFQDKRLPLTAWPVDYRHVYIDATVANFSTERDGFMASYDPAAYPTPTAGDKWLTSANVNRNANVTFMPSWGSSIPIWDFNAGRLVEITGTKTDGIDTVPYPVKPDKDNLGTNEFWYSWLPTYGYYTDSLNASRKIAIVPHYYSNRIDNSLELMAIPIEVRNTSGATGSTNKGSLNLSSPVPVAVNQNVTCPAGGSTVISPLTNDSANGGAALSLHEFTQPVRGRVVNNGNNTVTYTPQRGFIGTDTFRYWNTNKRHFARANITVTVS
ncbi:MAG: hypothetical protein H0V81_04195 [Solirubrobacterales bacterium]|nr:hypothetical protein [Solirubrobacterales bacterium]